MTNHKIRIATKDRKERKKRKEFKEFEEFKEFKKRNPATLAPDHV